ncbi:MAG: MATE family efflux transporter [Polyangiaceae bacterium]|nr:MATE family efflux transporter [Polyangiaceae bacterium]
MTEIYTKPSLAVLLHLAWPIVVSRSAQVVVGFADAAMVARIGESALAATTTGALNTFSLFILPMGIVFIVSSFSAQLLGRGDFAGARRYGWYGLAVSVMAQLLCMAGILFVDRALLLFDYAPDVRSLMGAYLKIRLLSGGAAIGLEALANYYGGLGNTRLPMLAQVLCMVLNVALNWVLIYGNLGAPALGVEGAAIASATSTGIAFLALFACFATGFGAKGGKISSPLKAAELFRMLRFGLPSGFNWFFEMAAFSFFVNVVVTALGTTSLAAFMAVMQLNSIAFMPAFGIASAGAILVGQAIGAKRHDDVPSAVGLTLRTAAIWQGLVSITYVVMPRLLMRSFADPRVDATHFLDVGARLLMLSAAWQLFDAAANTLSEALRAAGDTAFCMWMRTLIAWLIFVPGVLVTVRVFGGGDIAAVLWVVAYIGLLALVLALRFRSGAWRKLDLAGSEVPVD